MSSFVRITVLIALCGWAFGCGQTGPLRLPGEAEEQSSKKHQHSPSAATVDHTEGEHDENAAQPAASGSE